MHSWLRYPGMTLVLLLFFLYGCSGSGSAVAPPMENPDGDTPESRFSPPEGFERIKAEKNFGAYLRSLPLKESGSPVKLFDGRTKSRDDVHVAVVDLPIGSKDLHQCADAVIRLRAEYLWMERRYEEIGFNFTNGFHVAYSEWMKGKRINVRGNQVSWEQKTSPSNTHADLWNYLETVFTYAGTLSLAAELKPKKAADMAIGDVFIQGGSPGHAVIVVDMAIHPQSGRKVFMLAQSYMPAQEIHLLKNPGDADGSPWYPLDFGTVLETPEWTFSSDNLKSFRE